MASDALKVRSACHAPDWDGKHPLDLAVYPCIPAELCCSGGGSPGLQRQPCWQFLWLPSFLLLLIQLRIPLGAATNINPQVPFVSDTDMQWLLCNELGFRGFLKKKAGKHAFGPRTCPKNRSRKEGEGAVQGERRYHMETRGVGGKECPGCLP